MDGGNEVNPVPARPDEAQVPKVGVDSWVASHEERTQRTRVQRWLGSVPTPAF
jgi:hypothetical protein